MRKAIFDSLANKSRPKRKYGNIRTKHGDEESLNHGEHVVQKKGTTFVKKRDYV